VARLPEGNLQAGHETERIAPVQFEIDTKPSDEGGLSTVLGIREAFLSKLVFQTYSGYVTSQFKKMQTDIRNH